MIAYEPIWSIGPGKTPAGKEYITKIAKFVKEKTNGMDIVYGGGLKQDNAEMLASIDEIDGGLIALTRFQGEIGYYPEEYLEIIRLYMGRENNKISIYNEGRFTMKLNFEYGQGTMAAELPDNTE